MSNYGKSTAIRWKWVFISIGIFFLAQVVVSVALAIVSVLTLGVGFLLFVFLKPIAYFVTGIVTGYLSPGITIKEPAIGAVIISVLGFLFDLMRSGGGSVIITIIVCFIAYFVALAGAKIGERLQGSFLE